MGYLSSSGRISLGLLPPAIVALLVIGLGPPVSSTHMALAPTPHSSDFPQLIVYHGNIYANASGPAGFADIGSRVSAQFRFMVPDFRALGGGNQLRIPDTIALLPAHQGVLRVYLPSANVTVNGNTTPTDMVNGSVRLTSPVTFNASSVATLSSQGLAVMASWPVDEFRVEVQWQWLMIGSDGSSTTGAWSNWSIFSPAQIVSIQNTPPAQVSSGALYPMCLGGPIASRTFSVHLSTTTPFRSFSGPAVTVPPGFVGNFCFNSSMPAGISPQSAVIHLWEYSTVTFLLYQLNIEFVNSSTSGPSTHVNPPHSPWPPWVLPAAGILVLGIVGLGVGLLVRARRSRR